MGHDINLSMEYLMGELNKDSSFFQLKAVAGQLEQYKDVAIPLLIEALNDRNNSDIRENAFQILAIMGDYRGILSIIRHAEQNNRSTGHIFELLIESLQKKNDDERKNVGNQLITYLQQGPTIPKSIDNIKNRTLSADEIEHLKMKRKELPPHKVQLLDAIIREWSKESSKPPEDKSRIPEYQNNLVEVIDTLKRLGGLQNPQIKPILEGYIKQNSFGSIALQHALTALATINPVLATLHLNQLMSPLKKQPDTTEKRVISNKIDKTPESIDFSICVRENNEPESREKPYSFKLENGLVFFLARGEEEYKWFVGQAQNKNDAIQIAIKYLGKWISEIDSMNQKTTQAGKYSRKYTTDRYSEYVHLLEENLDFKRWGFLQSFLSQRYEYPMYRPQIIYDSEWCRIKFSVTSIGDQHNQSDLLYCYYGRLHAPNHEEFMIWNGEKCRSWHRVDYALNFLDGLSPEEALKVEFRPRVIEEYRNSEKFSGMPHPVQVAGTQSAIWNHYGQRLFELFDLRRPDLWEQYRLFIKEFYKSKDSRSYGDPPADMIC